MNTATLLSTNALLSAASTIVMFVVLRTRKTYPGFGFWTVGVACLALGAAMLVPGALPTVWYVAIIRNCFLIGGLLLLLRGMLIFRGAKLSCRWDAIVILTFLLVFGYHSLDPAKLDARIAIYCTFAGLLSFAMAVFILKNRPPYFGSNDVMLAVWLLVYGVLNLFRIVHQFSDPNISTAFEALKGFGSFYALAQILTVQLVTLTLISTNSQRIEYEYLLSESKLRESEQQLRAIGDNVPDGFVYQFEVRDSKRGFRYISAGVEKLLGLNPSELVINAQPLFDLMAPNSYARYIEDEALFLKEKSNYSGLLEFRSPTNRIIWLDIRSAPMEGRNGELMWAGVAVDVTKLKTAETELERHRNHLEAMVDERTAALSIAKLEAEAANRAKSAFLANMSHELRTPMNGVLGMAHLIRRGGVSPKQGDQLDKLESSGKHLVEVINDILDFSKIEAGKVVLEHTGISLGAIMADTAAMLSPAAEVKGLVFSVEYPPVDCHCLGDPTRLKQAILNFASNAIKFTQRGHVVLRFVIEEETENDFLVRFEVEDTGIGIDKKVAAKLFHPFEQADVTTTRKYGGTGLGLVITKSLAELMGGTAGCNSALNEGSTFWFTARLQKA